MGDPNNCGAVNVVITGAVDLGGGNWVQHAGSQVTGTSFVLDARQSTSGDDPNTGPVEGSCLSGSLEFQWVDGSGTVLQPFSPGGSIEATQTSDSFYSVSARCSSDLACAATASVQVLSYPGDGSDISPGVDVAGGGFVPNLDGLSVGECDPNGNVELSWRSRPQPPGVMGYSVHECLATGGGQCTGGGPSAPEFVSVCAGPSVTPGAVGAVLTTTRACPAAGTATLWAVGHKSMNALALVPLGFDPVSGQVVLSSGTVCP